jgi:hypothetical protein
VQQSVIEAFPEVWVGIVWIKMNEKDTEDAAGRADDLFEKGGRICSFYDPGQRTGRAVALSLGGEAEYAAWDIYLLYDRECRWAADLPAPLDWIHQMSACPWADPARYFTGEALIEVLHRTIQKNVEKGSDKKAR